MNALRAALGRPSGQVLLLSNLALAVAVVALGWSVLDVVFLYWVENVVIGVINVLRMAISSPDASPPPDRVSIQGQRFPQPPQHVSHARRAYHASKLGLIPFFAIHYGGFCLAHGAFVIGLLGADGASLSLATVRELLTPSLALGVGLLAVSHLYSFLSNFVLGGEYRRTNAAALMMRPYGRIVALHVTILLGALLVELAGSNLGLLVVLVVAKTVADLVLHEAERGKLDNPAK